MAFLIFTAPLFEQEIGEIIGIDFTGFPEYYVYFMGGAAGVILMGIALANPFWGIIIFMVLLPFRSEEYALLNVGGAIVRPADPVALFTFIGLLNRDLFTYKKGLPLERLGIELPLIVFAWWSFLSIAWCVSYGSAVSKLLQFSYAIVVLYMVTALIKTKEQLVATIWGWLLGGVVLGGLAAIEALENLGGGGGRAESLQTSALETGEYLNYPILMSIGLFMVLKNKLLKGFALICFAIMLFATLLGSASRGPLLGLGCALVFLYFFCDRFRGYVHWLIPISVVGAVAAFFVLGLFGENLIELIGDVFARFIELMENPESDVGLAYRLDIWAGLWQIFLEHPILGIGVGSLPELLPVYTAHIFQNPELAHNMYFEVFIAVGSIGCLFFLWFLWRILRIMMQHIFDRTDYGLHLLFLSLLAAQVAKAVGNLTFGLFYEDRVEWVAIAMCFATVKVFQQLRGENVNTEEVFAPKAAA